jgi:hypothetical protein
MGRQPPSDARCRQRVPLALSRPLGAPMTAPQIFETQLRHHCRRCKQKLKEPIENPRSAFCCRGCYRQFFAKRCLVCEKEIRRTAGHQKLCGSLACRREYRDIVAHGVVGKFSQRPQCTSDGLSPSTNPIKQRVCGPEKSDRPWRQVAGPALSRVEMRLATLPMDTGPPRGSIESIGTAGARPAPRP